MAADVLPVECDSACGGVIQPDDAPADGGFARAGLAHQTIGLAGIDLKADIVHGLDREVFVHLEILLQPLDLQQRGSALCCHLLRLLDLFCFCAHPGHTFLQQYIELSVFQAITNHEVSKINGIDFDGGKNPVNIEINDHNQVIIGIDIVIDYGLNVGKVVSEIQNEVVNAIDRYIGFRNVKVNVNVNKIKF